MIKHLLYLYRLCCQVKDTIDFILHLLRYERKKRLLQVLLSHLVDAPVGFVSDSATMSSLLEFIVRTDYASNTCKYNSTSIYCNVICDMLNGKSKRSEEKNRKNILRTTDGYCCG